MTESSHSLTHNKIGLRLCLKEKSMQTDTGCLILDKSRNKYLIYQVSRDQHQISRINKGIDFDIFTGIHKYKSYLKINK